MDHASFGYEHATFAASHLKRGAAASTRNVLKLEPPFPTAQLVLLADAP